VGGGRQAGPSVAELSGGGWPIGEAAREDARGIEKPFEELQHSPSLDSTVLYSIMSGLET
jgi:hypothetical protein